MSINIREVLFNNGYSASNGMIKRRNAIMKTLNNHSRTVVINSLSKLKNLYKEEQPNWTKRIEDDIEYIKILPNFANLNSEKNSIKNLQKGGKRDECHLRAYGTSTDRV